MRSDALDCLRRMAEAYAGCSSYRDHGTATTWFIEGDGRRANRLQFETRFDRPGGFLFRYVAEHETRSETYAVWLEGGTAQSWWTVHGHRVAESLGLALAAATGVSMTSAHVVPRLLIPVEVGGWCLSNLEDVAMRADEEVHGHPCRVVDGRHPHGIRMRVHVDCESWLIRRVWELPHRLYDPPAERPESLDELRRHLPPGAFETYVRALPDLREVSTEHVLEYRPEIDVEIDPAELRFTPGQ